MDGLESQIDEFLKEFDGFLKSYYLKNVKNGRVVFLGKIKECLACKQPDMEDKIKTKLT